MGLGYVILVSEVWRVNIKVSSLKMWKNFLGIILLFTPIIIYLYKTNESAYDLLRFGFEGFFNWIETGKWTTGSTEILKTMWVLPDNIKTWMIGDGYFNNPNAVVDDIPFYMNTDIGYCRFIFYCGIIGFIVFASFFVYLTVACYKKYPKERHLFLLLLVLVFVVWAKVSTDIFLVYAIFIAMKNVQATMNPQQLEQK
jgi:hypothetical protein